MRIGIYSGTFDPVHNGHIALAREALSQCELDRVIFIPEAVPRGKQAATAQAHRLKMLELAIAGQTAMSVISLHSRQFTVAETLPEINGLFPDVHLMLIIGSDVVPALSQRWPDLDILLAQASLAIGLRGSDTVQDIEQAMQAFPAARYHILTTSHHLTSSSAARSGHDANNIPPAVALYITQQRLYM